MKRQVCWVEKLEDGVKREIRVTVHGGKIKWQFKRSDMSQWDYDSAPTEQDWDALQAKCQDRYRRKACSLKDLELIRKARQLA